jgi:hypothetical protein
MEDVEIMRRVKRLGGRVVFLDAPVRTSARRWLEEGVVYATLRNYALQILYCAGVIAGTAGTFFLPALSAGRRGDGRLRRNNRIRQISEENMVKTRLARISGPAGPLTSPA